MKTYRRIISFVCALLFLIPLALPAYAADAAVNFTVSTDKDTYQPGETIYITFNQDVSLTQVSGYELLVYYDPDLVEWDEDKTDNLTGLSSAAYTKETPTNGTRIKLADVNMDAALAIAAGTVNTVAFTAKEEGMPAFTFSATVYDSNFEPYTTTCTAGTTVTVSAPEVPEAPDGYYVYASADSFPTDGQPAQISIYASNSDDGVSTYNAYDLTLTYDMDKLTLEADEETRKPVLGGAAASDNADVNVTGNQIHIAGVGENKTNATDPIVTLNFTMNTTGVAEVSIVEAKVDNKGQAIENNAVKAAVYGGEDATPGSAQITVPYKVEKPGYVEGDASVLPGADYTFSFADTDCYNYSGLTVTMGGETLILTPNADGIYTIENVNGDIEITVTQKGKEYNVTIDTNNTATVSGAADKAYYGENYTFTVEPADATVTVTGADNKSIAYTIENGQYLIDGKDIKSNFTITAMAVVQPDNTTKISFDGVSVDEIVGGLVQYAPNGQAFDFTLKIQENFEYTAKIGDESVAQKTFPEGESDEEGELTFTIPGDKLDGTPITVNITKTSTVLEGLTVEVSNYIQLDKSTMFLVTAKAGESALAYGDAPMYRSEKYDAYSWLVISADSMDTVKTAAEGAISVYTGTEDKTIAYDFDVNQTNGVVDINDAQLTYDMYTAEYERFEENLGMDKFLEADLNGDKKVWSDDAAAIINSFLNPTTTQEPQQ